MTLAAGACLRSLGDEFDTTEGLTGPCPTDVSKMKNNISVDLPLEACGNFMEIILDV
jgi:hypothetical protein